MKLIKGILKELAKLKIRDIKLFDSMGKSILADYFIVSTADSSAQLEAAHNKLTEYMKKHAVYLKNPLENWHGGWCLMDFGNIIIHIFLEETRSFYNIDGLMENSDFRFEDLEKLSGEKRKEKIS